MMLQTAIEAAKKAEKIVMTYFEKEKNIQNKGKIDLVTRADIEAEKKILEVIKNKHPDHGFILEEQDNIDQDAEYVWIIDPIDGTTSFAHNYPFFSISIALYRQGEAQLGVVLVPYLKELFHAEKGKGAFLNGKKISVSKTESIETSLLATGFPYTRLTSDEDNLDFFSRMAKKAQGLRRSGSAAIDICYVACGRVDAYWEINLKIMDTAAAKIILEEAGGRFSNFQDKDIIDDFTTIAASNGLVHEELLDILGER